MANKTMKTLKEVQNIWWDADERICDEISSEYSYYKKFCYNDEEENEEFKKEKRNSKARLVRLLKKINLTYKEFVTWKETAFNPKWYD